MPLISSIRALLVGAVLLLLGQPLAWGADAAGAYTFRSYGPEQGLRNQAVTGMAQDRDGFILAATEDGLFRYDGNRFERFGMDQGMFSDSIVSLYTEPGGRVWVISNKGAMAWNGATPDPLAKTVILPNEKIFTMGASMAGSLIVTSAEGVYEGPPDKLVRVPGLPSMDGGAVWIAPNGQESLIAWHGDLYQRIGRGAWTAYRLPVGSKNELIHTVIKDARGRIWLRGPRLLLRMASARATPEDLSSTLPGAAMLRGHLALDPQGRAWTTTTLGVARFDDRGIWILAEQQGLPTQSAASIMFDREGNLWVSSEGVHRLQGRFMWSAQTRHQKLPSDTVWNVARSRDGVLWAGTNRGLAQSTPKGWVVLPGTEERIVYTLAQDAAGNLWAGGNNAKAARNALLMRPADGSAFRSIPISHLEGPGSINSMDFGPDGALYLGMMSGLHRLVRDGDGYRGEAVSLPKGGNKEQINQVLRDPQGRLWVAGANGLAFFDGHTWRRFGKQHGLLDSHIETVAVDQAGTLVVSYWNVHGMTQFATNAAGLLKATQLATPVNLVSDNIYSLGFDAHGALWMGTAQGVKRWKDGRVEQFGRGEGLPSEDAAANAFWADSNGDVWVGMASGLAHYHADAQPGTAPLPATHVLRLEDGAGASLSAPVPEVTWENRTLTFRFAVLSYLNETRIHAQVRLLGFEDAWRGTDIREARYTGLPPGKYRFEVRASMSADEYGPTSMREVIILAPWWRTAWAAGMAVIAAGLLLFLFMRWRHGRLQRGNAELAALVRARTEALEQANAALHDASMIDPLTGLKNRRFLGLSMPDELARVMRQFRASHHARDGVNKTLLIFMVDLDHFKAINDTYGHAAGDLVLQQASTALRGACRDADFVVRWGGEEFLIVARNSDRSAADVLANKLRDAVRDLRIDIGNGVILEKTCSLGFAAFPVLESEPEAYAWEDAVKMADQCLYAAKHSGRDAWVGVVLSANAPNPGPRVTNALGDLVAEAILPAMTSIAPEQALRWR
ncbi:diguanylate cyclase [Massilia sp. TSP1-1-2]|uniref:ligand-binding sensor domain-containing diguanylate cyclase n=1 Tax=Massilia sp. TSP1-1-2 TaxID=2804649 RepID=UPI003CF15AD0